MGNSTKGDLYTHTHTHTRMHTHTHTHRHTYIHAYIHTYMHTYILKAGHVQSVSLKNPTLAAASQHLQPTHLLLLSSSFFFWSRIFLTSWTMRSTAWMEQPRISTSSLEPCGRSSLRRSVASNAYHMFFKKKELEECFLFHPADPQRVTVREVFRDFQPSLTSSAGPVPRVV